MSTPGAAASAITISSVFQNVFRVDNDRVAVTSEDSSQTYREVGERSARLAAALTELGVRKGDRVAVLSETRPEYVETYAALASLGVTALMVQGLRDKGRTIRHWVCFDRDVEISGDDIHNVLYTSGTTGRPKGAMISQSAAACELEAITQATMLRSPSAQRGFQEFLDRGRRTPGTPSQTN